MQVVKFPTCPVDPLAVLLHVLGQLIWVLSVPDSLLTSGLGNGKEEPENPANSLLVGVDLWLQKKQDKRDSLTSRTCPKLS